MLKVAIIRQNDCQVFVQAVADFIAQHDVVDIKYAVAVIPTGNHPNGAIASIDIADSAMILYREREEAEK